VVGCLRKGDEIAATDSSTLVTATQVLILNLNMRVAKVNLDWLQQLFLVNLQKRKQVTELNFCGKSQMTVVASWFNDPCSHVCVT
jgi:hypothetical protein